MRNMKGTMDNENLFGGMELCIANGFLEPKAVVRVQACNKFFSQLPISWESYKGVLSISLDKDGAENWLLKNVASMKHLQIKGAYKATNLRSSLEAARSLVSLELVACNALLCVPASSTFSKLVCRFTDVAFLASTMLPSSLQCLELEGCKLEDFPLLPEDMHTLKVVGIIALPALPSALRVLCCKGYDKSQFEQLPELPTTLESLELEGCALKALPKLSEGLHALKVVGPCCAIEALPALPNGLRVLRCAGCVDLKKLPELPSSLECLELERCALEDLPELPESIRTLKVGCRAIKALPALPSALRVLHITENDELSQLPKLPISLECLEIKRCSFKALPNLPQGIHTLKVYQSAIKALPALPRALRVLCCDDLEELPELPCTLKALQMAQWHSALKTLPKLPEGMHTLMVEGNAVRELPVLPSALRVLRIAENDGLAQLPKLPTTLEFLEVSKAYFLEALPNLPEGIHTLKVYQSAIKALPALPTALRVLCCKGCYALAKPPELLPCNLERLEIDDCAVAAPARFLEGKYTLKAIFNGHHYRVQLCEVAESSPSPP